MEPVGSNTTAALRGSVGDGPIIGATIEVYDANGNLLNTEVSDAHANYMIRVPVGKTLFPVSLQARGGTDIVTQRVPDFTLHSVALSPAGRRVNINPFTTLIVRTAAAMPGGLTPANMEAARIIVTRELNYGLDAGLIPDPVSTTIDETNVANVIKASEAVSEIMRRLRSTLLAAGQDITVDALIIALAQDLSDGLIDGSGGPAATARIAAVTHIRGAQVLMEAMINRLHVDGALATPALDGAIMTVEPKAERSTADVTIIEDMTVQLRDSLSVTRAIYPDPALDTLAQIVSNMPSSGSPSNYIEPLTQVDTTAAFTGAIMTALNTPEYDLASAIASADNETVNGAPSISGSPPIQVQQNTTYSFAPIVSDPDGDTLTFSITNRPSWAAFNTSTGTLTGIPGNADVGTTAGIVISVTDGAASVSLPAFDLTVLDVNDAPLITGTPAASVLQGDTYGFTPAATDPDGDPLTFSIVNKPAWATFDVNSGTLTGIPGNADVGTTAGIVVSVTDGAASASLPAFDLTVLDVNDAPLITGTPSTTVTANSLYSFTPAATDPDGDPLTFSIVNKPAWATFDVDSGVLAGAPAANDAGTVTDIVISVSDGSSTAALPAFDITVNTTVNEALLSWVAPSTRADGSPLALSELAGFRIYKGNSGTDLALLVELDDSTLTEHLVTGLASGTHYFAVTAYDTNGAESALSAIVSKSF